MSPNSKIKSALTISPACLLALAISSSVSADPYADSVVDSLVSESCCTNPEDALGAPDGVQNPFGNFVSLNVANGDFIHLDFDNNLCFESGDGGPDLIVYEYLGSETKDVAVGLKGGLLSGSVGFTDSTGRDLSGVISGSFNTVKIVSTSSAGAVPGADIDAVECLHYLNLGDIEKTNTGLDNIDVGLGVEQTGFSFSIEISNNTGIDGLLDDLVFVDSVPAEFDLDPDAEDSASVEEGCTDGDCDGIDKSGATSCEVSADTSNGAKKKGRAKLEPEIITIVPNGLLDGDSCLVEVFVKTDTKDFPKGNSPAYTPTSCLEDPGVIVLNDGVRVYDDAMNLLLDDDDMLTLACNNFTD